RVYGAQNTPLYRKKALEVLEKLVAAGNLANPEDRSLLARLYSLDGEWAKARERYRVLIEQTENKRDYQVLIRRPGYLAQYIVELLKHHPSGQDQEALIEARELIEKLKRLRPDNLAVLDLDVQIYRAQNQVDKAVELVQAAADRPKLTDG